MSRPLELVLFPRTELPTPEEVNDISRLLLALLRSTTKKNFTFCETVAFESPARILFRPMVSQLSFSTPSLERKNIGRRTGQTLVRFTPNRDVDDFQFNRGIELNWNYHFKRIRDQTTEFVYYVPNQFEYARLVDLCQISLLEGKYLLSSDPLSFYLVTRGSRGTVVDRTVNLPPIPDELSLEVFQGLLVASRQKIYDYAVVGNETFLTVDQDLENACDELRGIGIFTLSLDELSDLNLYSEIAEMYNIEKLGEYPMNQPIAIFRCQDKRLGKDTARWMEKSLLYIKNGRFPRVTLEFPRRDQRRTSEQHDAVLYYAYFDAIVGLLTGEDQTDQLSSGKNVLSVLGNSQYTTAKNGFLSFDSPSVEFLDKMQELITDFMNNYSKDLLLFPLPSGQDLLLTTRYYLQQQSENSIRLFVKDNILIVDPLNQEIESLRREIDTILDSNIASTNSKALKQGLLDYYSATCREDNDPISRQDFRDMSLTELSELIIGYDLANKGKPYCFEKNVLARIRPREVNPITQVPFLTQTLNQISLVDLAKSGLFDIGPLKGLLNTSYYQFDELDNGLEQSSQTELVNTGVINYNVNEDGNYLYYMDQANGKRLDLFVKRAATGKELDNRELQRAWESNKLNSRWFSQYRKKTQKQSSFPIDQAIVELLVSERGASYLSSLTSL